MIDSINAAVIEAAAVYAGNMIDEYRWAEVDIEPGDATHYKFVVLAPSEYFNGFTWHGSAADHDAGVHSYAAERKDYLVTLATGFGKTYPWRGCPLDGRYCAEKWSNEGRASYHTGEVVALFLTALSSHLAPVA